MGLFNNYMKPGKGVSKDEPEKKGFFLYWDILFHKFSKILGANCMYMLTSLLWIAVLMFIYMQFIIPIMPERISGFLQGLEGVENVEAVTQAMVLSMYTMFAVMTFTMLGSGPVSASYAYIMRNFTNREHAWILSDGWDKFKENFKQAIFVVIVDAVILIVGVIALKFYYYKFTEGGVFFGIPCYIMVVALIVFMWMHFYIYQIMVTFSCTIKQLYKNALIFALGKLPMNIVLTVICAAVSAAPYLLIANPFVSIIISGTIGLCFSRFVVEFYAARCMKKAILAGEKKNTVHVEYDNTHDDEPVFDDDLARRINEKKDSEGGR